MVRRVGWLVLLPFGCGPVVATDHGGASGGGSDASTGADGVTISSTTQADGGGSSETGIDVDCGSPWGNATMVACAPADAGVVLVDGTTAFFDFHGEMRRVDVFSGEEPEVFVEVAGDVRDLTVVDEKLFWVSFEEGRLGYASLDPNGIGITGADGNLGSLASNGWKVFATDTESGRIYRHSFTSWSLDPMEVLYEGLDHPDHIVIRDDALYWATPTDDQNAPTSIVQGTVHGSTPVTVYTDAGSIEDIVIDESRLFVARQQTGGGTIEMMPVDDPAATQVLATTQRRPVALALTADRVVWAENGSNDTGGLASVGRNGGPTLLHIDADVPLLAVGARPEGLVVFRTTAGVFRLDE